MDKRGAVIQLQEKVEKVKEGYVNTIANFINNHAELVQLRFFAVVSKEAWRRLGIHAKNDGGMK